MAKLDYRGPQKRAAHVPVEPVPWRWVDWLTWVALGLALAMVLVRGTTAEYLRDTFDVTPGADAAPRAPGPATSLGLDLLCAVPALLVLLRRALDRSFTLRTAWSFVPLGLLTGWMLLSATWASDKFAAVVTAFHWAAAMSMLWAAAQLVRDWLQLRLVAAVLFGLLPVYVIQAVNYRVIDAPATLKVWQANRDKMMTEHGLNEGSFAARQFEAKLKLAELFGFFNSPNTFGGALSLLAVIGVGLVLQRVAEQTEARWAVPAVGVPLLAGVVILGMTKSRGAVTTFALALFAFALLWRARDALARRARVAYFAGVGTLVAGVLLVIGYGLARGKLPTDTLTFRWKYWIGAMGMFRDHPLLGTGWSNFSLSYLAHRVPSAPEEIKDPHDFLVRFATELGLGGLLLVVAWLARLWWELTRPVTPPSVSESESNGPAVVKFIAGTAIAALAIYLIALVDWAREPIEFLLMRTLFLGAMVLGGALAGLRSLTGQEPDDRPAPWVLYAMILAAGGMFVHNLIDFSMFEVGPMFLLAAVVGSALGLRRAADDGRARSKAGGLLLGVALACWLGVAVFVWVPIAAAEQAAAEGDERLRAGDAAAAERLYVEANRAAHGWNADYAYRAARASPPPQAVRHYEEAIAQNPKESSYRYNSARAELMTPAPRRDVARHQFEQALALDPNNVPLRLEFADHLAQWGERDEARRQYDTALRFNDQLDAAEGKRLRGPELEALRAKAEAMR